MTDLIKAADALADELQDMVDWRVQLAESVSAGFWDAEETPQVIASRTALTAYRQARESSDGVKVKPLDMPERRNGYWGNKDGYQVAHTRDGLFRVRFHGKVICRDIRGFDRAVEWANKHNETRIKAALED